MQIVGKTIRVPVYGTTPVSGVGGDVIYHSTEDKYLGWSTVLSDWVDLNRELGAPTSVTRVLGTAYRVSTTRPASVTCTVNLPGGDGNTTDQIYLELSANGTTNWIIVDEAYIDFDVSGVLGVGGQATVRSSLKGEIPTGWWYRIRRVTGTGTIVRTIENVWTGT